MNEPCEHDWEVVDESFDHEFGTEVVVYDQCAICGEQRTHDSNDDFYDDCDDDNRPSHHQEAAEWGGMEGY